LAVPAAFEGVLLGVGAEVEVIALVRLAEGVVRDMLEERIAAERHYSFESSLAPSALSFAAARDLLGEGGAWGAAASGRRVPVGDEERLRGGIRDGKAMVQEAVCGLGLRRF
jgi:hypothetical protein